MQKKVIVALSGGVDSAVTAALLLEQGYAVEGVHLTLIPDDDGAGCADAKAVAEALHIPFHSINMQREFAAHVIDYFVDEYKLGRTPNPCIACNEHIKFGLLFDKMQELGGDFLATGHYAKISSRNGQYFLQRAQSKKDQSYFLYRLSAELLPHILFPVCEFEKADTRKIAEKYSLPVAHKSDSQEICFIKNNNYVKFIREYSGYEPSAGNFIDLSGNILGQHSGIINYTVGQRKGLGISFGEPMFVTRIIPERNEVVLAPAGFQQTEVFDVENLRFVNEAERDTFLSGRDVLVKIRCQAPLVKAKATLDSTTEHMQIEFFEPQRAVTPGQSAVLYDADIVLGGGLIK